MFPDGLLKEWTSLAPAPSTALWWIEKETCGYPDLIEATASKNSPAMANFSGILDIARQECRRASKQRL